MNATSFMRMTPTLSTSDLESLRLPKNKLTKIN